MKNKVITIAVIVTIAITLVVVFTRNTGDSMERLFSEEEITYKNSESIELIEYKTNKQKVTDEKDFIKQLSSVLENLKSNNITTTSVDIDEEPLYIMHIKNVGYYPSGGIIIFNHQVKYEGRTQTLTSEESSTLIKLIEDEIQEENH